MKKGLIIFSDGTVIEGVSVGADGTAIGGLTPYSGLTDYADALCDVAFQDRIVCMTYPLIGQVGLLEDHIDRQPAVAGLLMREPIEPADHWRSEIGLTEWLKQKKVVAIAGIDTRAVTLKLRQQGALQTVLTTEDGADVAALTVAAQNWTPATVVPSVHQKVELAAGEAGRYHIAVLDLGHSETTLDALNQRGCRVSLWPDTTEAAVIMAENPDALLLSSGPEDAVLAHRARYAVLLGQIAGTLPVWGIDAGHLVIADYLGWTIDSMSPGHHGLNYPVRDLNSGRTYMTAQHHRHAVRPESSSNHTGEMTHVNINDQTVEGLMTPGFRSVQFIPDVESGSHQTGHLWDQWLSDLHE